jgi:hypothetical protein
VRSSEGSAGERATGMSVIVLCRWPGQFEIFVHMVIYLALCGISKSQELPWEEVVFVISAVC